MKTFITAASLAASVSATVLPRQDQCCFQLTASGGQSGQIGQLSDGQNRVGGSYQAGTYCLTNGTITDGNGRGCILTPPTSQFQCDQGATPDSGFSVSGSGELQHDGDSTFYACAAAEGEYNVYTSTSDDQTLCSEITLGTGGECGGSEGGASSSAPAASQPVSSAGPTPSSYSAPASSPAGPESTTPVPATSEASVPGYSAPVQSAPVPSASAQSAPAPAPSVSTRMVTVYSTVCGCESESAPAGVPSSAPSAPSSASGVPSSNWGYSAPSGSAPAPSAPAPAPSSYSAPSESQPTAVPSAPAPSSYSKPAESQPASVPSQSSPAGPASSAPGYPVPSGSAPAPSESAPVSQTVSASTLGGYTTQPASGTPPASTTGTGSASGSTCQTSLVPGSYETPHLIVPVSSNSPDESYGTSYNAYISSANSTIFNFDIPASDAGKTCTLVFLFPKKEDLETTDYTSNGQGSLDFAQLSGAVDESTTYNSCPSKQQDLGSVSPVPGGSYIVQSGACAAGTTETIEMRASGGLELEFFEDWNPSPLGLFITVC